jgi:serine/threonine-protein phosphatase PP1 catalytic subunit
LFTNCRNKSREKFYCHDDLSPDLHSFEQLRCIATPTDVPDTGLFYELLWFDPDKDTLQYEKNDCGASYTFDA